MLLCQLTHSYLMPLCLSYELKKLVVLIFNSFHLSLTWISPRIVALRGRQNQTGDHVKLMVYSCFGLSKLGILSLSYLFPHKK